MSDNYGQSVGGIVISGDKVLLVRHTYGRAKDRLLIPGGFLKTGETPQDAVRRELLEETGISAEPLDIVAVRFNMHDWYIAFRCEYLGGTERSDGAENSEVLWLSADEVARRDDVTNMSQLLVKRAFASERGLARNLLYESGSASYPPFSLYL